MSRTNLYARFIRLAPALAVLLFAAQALLSARLAHWVHPEPVEFSQSVRMDKRVASILRAAAILSGYKVLVGHAFWIKVIQYYGDSFNSLDQYSKLYDYCSLASDLNPRFTSIYTLGASALAFHLKRSNEAIRLLQKGINSNPRDINLKLLLAAVGYQDSGEFNRVIPILEAQVSQGDAPLMLITILANLYEKVGRYQDAVKLWQKILRESDQSEPKIRAGLKLQELYGLMSGGPKEKSK